ncbi:cytochrome P450 [Aspergillus taichungensis]|uniref:Cytochrome P450 n=1 Tax=Aspergillus taichungensis TaxID=482145 RepID=A0A2J5I0T2_9EURO|nr:cytochrome P450 [Aspergillus taichungensis]
MASLPTSAFIGALLSLIIYIAYRKCRPHPIPGIPYNKDSANRLLGDLPRVKQYARETGEKLSWFALEAQKMNTPIFQVFIKPLSKPWVVVTDSRESYDILLRRTKEFDRSDTFGNIFRGLVPDHHISMKSVNPEFKAHRRLIQDLMTPQFLNEVSAPRLYASFSALFDLWTEKARLAQGRPFIAGDDFFAAALDAIWGVTFPQDLKDGIIHARLQLLRSLETLQPGSLTSNEDDAVPFPEPPMPAAQGAILTLTDSLEKTLIAPIPALSFKLLSMTKAMRDARAVKEEMIATELARGKARLVEQANGEQPATRCAMDDILRREIAAAQKQNREPNYDTRTMYDELFGLLVAGHDTTSTTATWGLKFLSDHQEVQAKLRAALHANFTTALRENRRPTADEIAKAHIPYLDATQEEIIRKSNTGSAISRTATTDTVLLGHHIPKGTTVFLMGNGPDFHAPPVGSIAESARSESCQKAKGRVGVWDAADSHLFKPERWLTVDAETGREVFDSTAGPFLTFGLGPRGCFGRRMAYMELKIVFVLLLWDFELGVLPENVNSYAAVDKLTHQPRQCYLRLRSLRETSSATATAATSGDS